MIPWMMKIYPLLELYGGRIRCLRLAEFVHGRRALEVMKSADSTSLSSYQSSAVRALRMVSDPYNYLGMKSKHFRNITWYEDNYFYSF